MKNFDFNRYKDILPYDQTRVILKTNLENDYINANYINVISFILIRIHQLFFVLRYLLFQQILLIVI